MNHTIIYKTATSIRVNGVFAKGDETELTEVDFWRLVETKVKELVDKEPEKFDEVMKTAKDHLSGSGTKLTIMDTWFGISKKRVKNNAQ